jgi:hypothetical protein
VDILGACTVRFKAKNVTVLVLCEGCRKAGNESADSSCDYNSEMIGNIKKADCGCEEKLQDAFSAMFK